LAGRYQLERELGRGGMATVHLAKDLKHDRSVALKVLHPELAATLGPERFQREIRTTARLQHPHILPVLDSGTAAGQLWYAMPYVEGESLRDRLRRERQLPVEEAVQITREVADALGYAHAQGVVHRDIKPENLMLSRGHALVADFGVARALQAAGGDQLTETGIAVGTPAYMSPEQGMADPALDGRSDLYSLGCVLYEMLAGEAPYTGPSSQAIVAKRLREPIPHVRTVRETVPKGVDQALERALAKAPADRYPTAAAFADALVRPVPDLDPAPRGRPRAVTLGRTQWLILLGGSAVVAAMLGVVARGGYGPSKSEAAPAGAVRLAVLPFENLGSSENEYFVDGVTDEVRGRLTGLPALKVIARSSSTEYKYSHKSPRDIGAELGVRYLLTATVRWDKGATGDRIRVSPALVDVTDASTKWQQPFDAAMTDVFRVQTEIASQVAQALDLALGASERVQLASKPTTSLAAHDAFLRGESESGSMSAFDAPTLRKAVVHYEQAVALDSAYVQAWARLSRARSFIWANGGEAAADSAAALRAATRASSLDSNNVESRIAQGNFASAVLHQYPRGLAEYAAGLRVAPGNADLLSFAAANEAILGHWDSADVHLAQAEALDPRSATTALIRAHTLLGMRRYKDALEVSSRARALVPGNILAIAQTAVARVAQGDLAGGQQAIREGLAHVDETALVVGVVTSYGLDWVLPEDQRRLILKLRPEHFDNDRATWAGIVADAHWLGGDEVAARAYADSARLVLEQQVIQKPQSANLHASLGLVLAHLGKRDEAVREGERAVALVPINQDALNGPYQLYTLAMIKAVVGRHEEAVDLLESVLEAHCSISPAWLRLDPHLAMLRRNPRFERLVK
jgi:serine/threonine-protein kinase